MACSTGKIEHPTRDAALAQVRDLEYKDTLRNDPLATVGLEAYPCRRGDHRHWHAGRRPVPLVYHYDVVAALDAIAAARALVPPKPNMLPRGLRRRSSATRLAVLSAIEERRPLVWFSRNADWDFHGIPHPGVFVPRPAEETASLRISEGMLRIGVPGTVPTLLWRNYHALNRTAPLMRKATEALGTHSDWRGSPHPVPSTMFETIDLWYRGAWVDFEDVTEEEFDAYRAEVALAS